MVLLGKTGKGAMEQERPQYQYQSQFYQRHPEIKPEQDVYFLKRESYLQAKKVTQLFNVFTTQRLLTEMVLERPDNPKTFILRKLKDLQEYRKLPNKEPPRLFESTDFDLMFETYDPAHEGSISFEALINAMLNCTIPDPRAVLGSEFPELNDSSRISRQKFSQVMMSAFDQFGFQ